MGLFSSIGDVAKTVGEGLADVNPVTGIPLAVMGKNKLANSAGNAIFGGSPQSPNSMTNPVDPRLTAMQEAQTKNATDFGANLPAYEKQQQNTATDNSRQALASQLAGVTQKNNARGLLYGGLNAGEQANATAQNQATLNNTKANINTNAENQLSGLQAQALGTGMALNQSQQQQQEAAYQAALQQQLANNQAFGSMVGGLGSGAGLLAALG